MKFLDDFRDPALATRWADETLRQCRQRWSIMEVCGGQTHAIVRNGIDRRLSEKITLIHGPGCPVCVTPVEKIDKALALAARPEVVFCSFGDMLRVPGSDRDLLTARARGADVRTLYSPLDCLPIARRQPDKEVVFFAIGFETTAPVTACALLQARKEGLRNFSILCAHVLIPPAIAAIMNSPDCRVQALLAPGHVCSVTGCSEYEALSKRFRIPIVVTGFEPVDILQGIFFATRQLERGKARLENQYSRAVAVDGNRAALKMIGQVFKPVDAAWRGLGEIPASGLALREEFAEFDAENRFELNVAPADDSSHCISGEILQGLKKPPDCPAFARECTPESPLGAPMVSSEGACAAYYRYSRRGDGRLRTLHDWSPL